MKYFRSEKISRNIITPGDDHLGWAFFTHVDGDFRSKTPATTGGTSCARSLLVCGTVGVSPDNGSKVEQAQPEPFTSARMLSWDSASTLSSSEQTPLTETPEVPCSVF